MRDVANISVIVVEKGTRPPTIERFLVSVGYFLSSWIVWPGKILYSRERYKRCQ